MLRASSELEGETADLASVTGSGDGGLPGGAELVAFAEAAVGDDADEIGRARDALVGTLGEAEMVDAAGVIANFQRMVRIADGTGIPLDEPVLMMTQGIREDLGINGYDGGANTPRLNPLKGLLGKALAPFSAKVFKRVAASRRAPE